MIHGYSAEIAKKVAGSKRGGKEARQQNSLQGAELGPT